MSYQEEYRQKLTTAAEAVKAVKSGDWLDYGWTVCSPNALDKALAARMGERKHPGRHPDPPSRHL